MIYFKDDFVKDRFQISLLILSEFKQGNFCCPENDQRTVAFLMIS